MKITRKQLKRIIKEELLREDDVYMHVGDMSRGKDPDHWMYSSSDPIEAAHALLGLASVADPTMLTDLTDAALYSLQGKHREAALVIAFSAAGIGAGALTVKAMRAKKAARQSKMEQAAKDIRAQGSANSKKVAGSIEQGLKDADTYIADVAAGRRVKFPDRPASPGKGHGGGKPLKPGTVRTGTGEVVDAKPGAPRGEGHSRGVKSDPRAHLHTLDKVYRNAMTAAQKGDYSFWQLYAGKDPSIINFPVPGSKRWIQFEERYGISPADFHSQYSGSFDKIRPSLPKIDLSKILNAAKGLGRKLNPTDDELVLYRGVKDKSLTASEMTGHSGSGVQDFAANPNVAITYAGENGTVYAIKVPYDDAIDKYYSGSHALNSWKDGKTRAFSSEVYRVPLTVLEAAYNKGNFIGTGNISF